MSPVLRRNPGQRQERLVRKKTRLEGSIVGINQRLSTFSRRPMPSKRRERARLIKTKGSLSAKLERTAIKLERVQSGKPGRFGKFTNLGKAIIGRLPTNQPLPEGHTYFPGMVEQIRKARIRSAERAAAEAPRIEAERIARKRAAEEKRIAKGQAAERKRAAKAAAAESRRNARAGKPTRRQRISAFIGRVRNSIKLRQRLMRAKRYIALRRTVRTAKKTAKYEVRAARETVQRQIEENGLLLDELRKARRENESQAEELRQMRFNLERTVSGSEQAKSKSAAIIGQLNSTLAALEAEKTALLRRESELRGENQSLLGRVTEQERIALQQRQRAEAAEESARDLQTRLAKVAETTAAESQVYIQKLTGELGIIREKQRILAESTRRFIGLLKFRERSLTSENLSLRQKVAGMGSMLEEQRQILEQLSEQKQGLEAKLAEAVAERGTIASELRDLFDKVITLRTQIDELRRNAQSQGGEEHMANMRRISALEYEKAVLTEIVAGLRTSLGASNGTIQKLRAENGAVTEVISLAENGDRDLRIAAIEDVNSVAKGIRQQMLATTAPNVKAVNEVLNNVIMYATSGHMDFRTAHEMLDRITKIQAQLAEGKIEVRNANGFLDDILREITPRRR